MIVTNLGMTIFANEASMTIMREQIYIVQRAVMFARVSHCPVSLSVVVEQTVHVVSRLNPQFLIGSAPRGTLMQRHDEILRTFARGESERRCGPIMKAGSGNFHGTIVLIFFRSIGQLHHRGNNIIVVLVLK